MGEIAGFVSGCPGERGILKRMASSLHQHEKPADLFQRDGLYYVRLHSSILPEPLVVALHGVLSEPQALAAARALAAGPAETHGE